ncbi:hypothetical protein G6038_23310 [Rhodococcus sp. 14C212]|uniref:hypothetical protein n=1 Tax=Rhodococcus sp. 14C212 TaxID=2711209 RepID=UPI0013ED6BB4|nr:hypothetical protein [Rhodococcus sp. 14C212]NGP08350.1 hypothetical protein [Rhodococcus sp. 14C212]
MQATEAGSEDAWVLQPSAVAVLDGVWVGSATVVGAWVFGSLLWAVLVMLVCAGTHAVGRLPGGRSGPGPCPGETVTGVRASGAGTPEFVERGRTS